MSQNDFSTQSAPICTIGTTTPGWRRHFGTFRSRGASILAHSAPKGGGCPSHLEEPPVAHGDGSFGRRLAQLARIDLLAIDDFAIAPVTAAERNDLLELLDDRVGTRATLITSQLPVSAWHEWLNDPTLADAILDRIVHAAHKIALKGESMRRKQVMP